MLSSLISEMFRGREDYFQVIPATFPKRLVSPVDPRTYHSYVMWRAVEYPEKSKHLIWRVESFLGLDGYCGGDSALHCSIPKINEDQVESDIVVIDDAGLQFRDNREAWPKAITVGKPDWIIVKMSHPVARVTPDGLWEYLLSKHPQRTIVVTSITDLRKCSIRVSKGLSWERTAQNLAWEFNFNPSLSSLKCCAFVVVSLGVEGACLIKNSANGCKAELLYDPTRLEGDWSARETGYMLGYNVCLTAAITKVTAESADASSSQMNKGVRLGLELMRNLYRAGYGPVYKKGQKAISPPMFPATSLAECISDKSDHFYWRRIPDPLPPGKANSGNPDDSQEEWRILNDVCRDREFDFTLKHHATFYREQKDQELFNMASRIVEDGPESVLREVPTLRFGKLVTADRKEIEDLRRIANEVEGYCRNPLERPFCLAVFGSPGSGKSFGIKQMAKSVLPGRIQILVFNLTQFDQMKDLTDALHQVRDIGLSGKIPLVFWDEFDTQGYGWLKAFLAPMQDGEFQDGQITYHIGAAIFVFAGGINNSYARFTQTMDSIDPADISKSVPDNNKSLTSLKGRDFMSRLHDFLDVKGPNGVEGTKPHEDLFIIRRAILIRGLLQKHAPHLFQETHLDMDPDVIRALLLVDNYKHGARSIEAIITMSLSGRQRTLDKSSLPPLAQLDIHVDGAKFMSLTEGQALRRNKVDKGMLDILAAGVHQVYCEGAEVWKTEAALKTYEDLDEGLKEENRRHVLDILSKLDYAGCIVVRSDGVTKGDKLTDEMIETLSEMEHMRWMKSKVNMGWVYAPKRDNSLKHHPCLLPWRVLTDDELAKLDPEFAAALGREELPENEKQKDRVLVKAIPRILAMAGYVLKRL